MKLSKDKKQKGLESTIGKIIYGFLLFAPLLIVLTTCCYAIFNKNAYKSYYGSTINETTNNYVVPDNLVANEYYYATTKTINTETSYNGLFIYATNIENVSTNTEYSADYNQIRFFKATNTQMYIQIRNTNGTESVSIANNSVIKFKYVSTIQRGNIDEYVSIWYLTYNDYSYMDNMFEYSLHKAENSVYFNWAKDTGMYDVLHNTCTIMGINNTFTPFLMAYWLLISLIYFIYDIGLMLVMVMHRHIHELQESM